MNALARDLLGGLDRVHFARSCGLEPDAKQSEILRSKARRKIVCTSRQAGKSTIAAAEGAADAWYDAVHPEARAVLGPRAHALVLITSPTQRQSDETFAKLQGLLGSRIQREIEETVPRESGHVVYSRKVGSAKVLSSEHVSEWKVRSLVLASGARVVSLPGAPENIRGFSAVTKVIGDEFAFTCPGLLGALRPMLLVSRGSLSLYSTPNGKSGDFYEIFTAEDKDWERHQILVTDNPRIDLADLEVDRRELPAWLFEQEYFCKFMAKLGQVFSDADIDRALCDEEAVSV